MRPPEDNGVAFRLPSEVPHCRSIWIGVLQGTWEEMGVQYGQRCGQDIARNYGLCWESQVLQGESPWQKGRGESERVRYALAYLRRSFEELSRLRPEMIELLSGMAKGAAVELDRCAHAAACTHFDKVALLNYTSTGHFHPDWDFAADGPRGADRPRTAAPAGSSAERSALRDEHDDCNGLWVGGQATRTGHTYAMRTAQSKHIEPGGSGRERQVSYVAIPRDPAARVFWGNGRAGNLGGLGGGLMNDRGVCCLTSGAQFAGDSPRHADETCAPGIRDFLLASSGVIFSATARDAAEMATLGTDRYREQTGRKTVLRTRGCNIVFADAQGAFCVEQNARHYAIRRPGDLGEKGGSYLVHANHFKSAGGCFDEHNVFHADKAMADFAPESRDKGAGTYHRFWSGMWLVRENYGRIDDAVLREDIAASHCVYEENGRAIGGAQDWRESLEGAFCAHMGPFTDANPLGIGGNAETSVFDLTTREVWWVPVWPCHHKAWRLSWHYCDLRPFAEYRRLLWGY
jgi:hypothetical protein